MTISNLTLRPILAVVLLVLALVFGVIHQLSWVTAGLFILTALTFLL